MCTSDASNRMAREILALKAADSNVIAFPDQREVCETCVSFRFGYSRNHCVTHEKHVPNDFVCPDWEKRR